MPSKSSAQFSDRLSKKQQAETLALLRQLGGQKITEESGIAYHDGRQILLPEGMTLKAAAKLVQAQALSMEQEHNFSKVFRYRPWDGAYALQETLKEVFGVGGQGKVTFDFFGGAHPPQYINIEVDLGVEVKVPWGEIDFPPFEGTFHTGASNDPTYGMLFQVSCVAPKKYEPEIEGLWVAVEQRLRTKSIYKGKALVGVGKSTRQGYENPTFLDPYAIDPESVAFRKTVFDRLDLSVWGPIRTAQLQRDANLKVNKKTLLYGPYGTGKSLAGGLTARVAVDNGWTFIQAKTGEEDLNKVLKTAELYSPAVVFFEDIDTLIESDPTQMAQLLEMFDGVSSKNKEVMVLMTSNHPDSLSKGMTRVGRIDAAIEIGDLDRAGIERLIKYTFTPTQLSDDLDFDEIVHAMEGYEPAFIMGTFTLTKSSAVIRTQSLEFELATQDFIVAADTLRNQHDTHTNAQDRPEVNSLHESLKGLMREELQHHAVDEGDGRIVEYVS